MNFRSPSQKEISKERPLVSVIMPNYNCARFIKGAIESVIAQTYQNWELLIQDDFSWDESEKIALSYTERDRRIKFEKNKGNLGAVLTRNHAIRRSSGEFLAFLDSDDLWLPQKLERQLEFMAKNDCDFSFTRYEHISEDGKSLGLRARVIPRLTYKKLLFHCWPGCLTVIYKQNLQEKIYGPDVKKDNDHALFLCAIKNCKNAMGFSECLALYRIRGKSISRNKFKMILPYVKVLHEFEGASLPFAYFCVLSHTIVKAFFKYEKVNFQNRISFGGEK